MLSSAPQTTATQTDALKRRFIGLACVIFAALFGGALWSFSAGLTQQAAAGAEDKALAVTRLLLDDLQRHTPPERALVLDPDTTPEGYARFDRRVRARAAHFGIHNTKIYDATGTIVYAQDPTLVGLNFAGREELRKALAGHTVSQVLAREEYSRLYGEPAETALVETYVPEARGSEGGTSLVFESYQDFDPTMARVQRAALFGAGTLALLSALGLGSLLFAYRRVHDLRAQVETLEGLLPICASCKQIRVEDEPAPKWVPVESYFAARDRVTFTHGLCDDCVSRELERIRAMPRRRPVVRATQCG